MKLTLEQHNNVETEIIIRYSVMDQSLQRLVEEIRTGDFILPCKTGIAVFAVPADTAYYMESVDGKTFVYTEHKEYECSLSLSSIETKLEAAGFVRISKNCILNLHYLKCVTPLWNARLDAFMKNGEHLIITRHYVDSLKERLGI